MTTEMGDKYRVHRCANDHVWPARVILSDKTQNLSGEKTEWCPFCGCRGIFSSAPFSGFTIEKVTEHMREIAP